MKVREMRGAIFTLDAMFASALVLLMLVAWAGAHSSATRAAAEAAGEEGSSLKVIGAADMLVKGGRHDFSSTVDAAQLEVARRKFGLAEISAVVMDDEGAGRNEGRAVELWCVSRVVVHEKKPAVLRVCGR